jgi:hypothetical protein
MTSELPTQPQPPMPAPAGPPTVPIAIPPKPSPPPGAEPARRSGGLIPMALSAVALLLAVVAVGVSLYAVSRTGDTKATNTSAQPNGGTGAAPAPSDAGPQSPSPAERPAPTDASPSADTALDVLSPQASFVEAYKAQALNPLATSGTTAYLDLDEPRVLQNRGTSDGYLTRDYGSGAVPYFVFSEGTSVALADDPNVQPADCRELIRTGPVPTSQHVPAQRDRTICVATSLEDAKEQGIQQKLIIIHVNSLPDTGRVNLTLAAWKVPST